MRLFGSENIANMVDRLGLDEDTPIDAKILSNSIESAQKRLEAQNFNRRKNVLTYDDVMNQQREVIYKERRKILTGDNLKENVIGMIHHIIKDEMEQYANEKLYPEEWTLGGLIEDAEKTYAPEGVLK